MNVAGQQLGFRSGLRGHEARRPIPALGVTRQTLSTFIACRPRRMLVYYEHGLPAQYSGRLASSRAAYPRVFSDHE